MPRTSAQAVSAGDRKRQPTEVRRLLVVDAARDVIAERGLFATTMRDIAQAAEVSVGTLTYHFTGIAEILSEVLDREMALFYEPILDKARGSEHGAEALQVLIDCFFADDARTRQHWRLWLDFWSLSAHDERYAEWQQQAYLPWRDDVRAFFALSRKQGALDTQDLRATVFDFLTMFDGLAVQAYLPRSPLRPKDARAQLSRWLRERAPTDRHPNGGNR